MLYSDLLTVSTAPAVDVRLSETTRQILLAGFLYYGNLALWTVDDADIDDLDALIAKATAELQTPITSTGGTMEIGMIIPYAGANAPTNYLLCNGQEISQADYADLYSIIGDTYGTPADPNNFILPDLRGYVPAGAGGTLALSLGDTTGATTHTLTVQQLPSHNHDYSLYQPGSGTNTLHPVAELRSTTYNSRSVQNEGGNQPHNNVQPTIGLNYIIYTGE